ncbi:hypothetical protein ZIOFF_035485 [Zingiber officinale]|uniref:Retrotransposon gag domain-containing protein n=1 Tax=Zingiber officinale TaxID=94328 RepID=A0A8J5GEN9_ZINOF|nr:hypothetical protein ZIOFF_035485 [Zingiber officinale]
MSLRQGDLSVAEFVKKLDRGCHFVPLIANDATEKLRHFLDGLRPTIRRDVLLADPTEYQDVVTRAFRAKQSLKDIEWEVQRKRHPPQQQQQHNKKSYTGPQKGQGQSSLKGKRSNNHRKQLPQRQRKSHCVRSAIASTMASDCGIPTSVSNAEETGTKLKNAQSCENQ